MAETCLGEERINYYVLFFPVGHYEDTEMDGGERSFISTARDFEGKISLSIVSTGGDN